MVAWQETGIGKGRAEVLRWGTKCYDIRNFILSGTQQVIKKKKNVC